MKKLTLGFFSFALLALGACSTDVEDSTQTVTYSTVNLISPLDGGESFASAGDYKFFLNLTQLKGSASTANLSIDSNTYSFQTDTTTFLSFGTNRGMIIRMPNLKGYLDNNKEMPLRNATFDITSLYYIGNIEVPDYKRAPEPYPYVIGQYTAGNWKVATFQKDAAYYGETNTSYTDKEGQLQTFKYKEMLYRLIINIKEKTADMIIYNAKFAEKAPVLSAILVKGLKVSWRNGGYTIEGENLVPGKLEGNKWIDYPQFMFDKITFNTVNPAMTQATITYEVASIYRGQFAGSYVVEFKQE